MMRCSSSGCATWQSRARYQPQRIRIARRLDRNGDEERDDRFAGQVKITAKMTKPAMAADRRYVDLAADRKRPRWKHPVIHPSKRPDHVAKLGIDAISRAARREDGPPRVEAIPRLVEFFIARA